MPSNDSARSEAYLLAVQNGYNAPELVQYIDEDHCGGYHVRRDLATWPSGSLWESEGQILYALTRYLKPQHIVEIGTLYGCSATHFATALLKNGSGRITIVDNRANGKFGDLIPLDRWQVIDKVEGDGGEYLESLPDNSVDLIFEDAGHGEEDVYRFTLLALRKLKPGGLLINHDAGHDSAMYWHDAGYVYQVSADDGAKIRAGLTRAGAEFQVYKPHESDCGFAVTKKPEELVSTKGVYFTVAPVPEMNSGHMLTRVKVDSEALPPDDLDLSLHPNFVTLYRLEEASKVMSEQDIDAALAASKERFDEDMRKWGKSQDSEAIEPEPMTMEDILSAGSPLNSDSFLKPADDDVDISQTGAAHSWLGDEPDEPPVEKKPRKKRIAKGKS